MTNNSLTPAQRMIQHENNITSNIKAIKHNNDLVAYQDELHKALLQEKTMLDEHRPTLAQRIGFDGRLEQSKSTNHQDIISTRQKTTDLKNETLALKEDTYAEKAKLDQAHLDEQAQHQNNIKQLEQSRDSSASRLDRLENYQENDKEKQTEQDQKIQQERKVLAQREKSLAQAKEESKQAEAAAAKRKAKVAKDVKEACPLKCKATELTVYSNNDKRAYKLPIRSGEPVRTLQVISASQAAVKKKLREPAVSVISAEVVGSCEKGKLSTAPAASNEKELIRESCDEYCPIITLDQDPLKIALPGAKEQPLKLQAFCPSPPENFTSWVYFLQTVFMEKKRTPTVYNLEAQGCDGGYPMAVQVEAYPKVKFELGVSIGYKPLKEINLLSNKKEKEDKKEIKSDYKKGQRTVEYGSWVFEFNLKGSADHVNLAAKLEHLDPDTLLPKLRQAINAFVFIFDIIRICCNNQSGSNIFAQSVDKLGNLIDDNTKIDSDLATSLQQPEADKKKSTVGELARIDTGFSPTGSVTLNYPKLSLGLSYENCEAMGKPTLGDAVALQLKLDPLIGIKAKVDILSALIKIGANALLPGSAQAGRAFVKYMWPILKDLLPDDTEVTEQNIKDRNYYLEGGVALVLTVGANVTAEGKWTHKNDAENLTINHVDLPPDPVKNPEVGTFSGMAGASLEMHGLALIRASYKTFSIGSKDNSDKDTNGKGGLLGGAKQRKSETKPEFSTKDLKNQWVLIEPGKTPKDTDPVPLYDYFNA